MSTEEKSKDDLDAIVAAARDVQLVEYPGGWPGEIEAALIDAVLSIQARYGGPKTGVRGATNRYREAVGGPLDDLDRLAAFTPEQLAAVLDNRQMTAGRSKAGAIVEAAGNLVGAGVHHADDLSQADPRHRSAYVKVRGLGWITWDYLLMLLGKPGVKADTWIVRWVETVLGRPSSGTEARQLVLDAAAELAVESPALDHSIWVHMSSPLNRQASR